jgi:hypothetical protein
MTDSPQISRLALAKLAALTDATQQLSRYTGRTTNTDGSHVQ